MKLGDLQAVRTVQAEYTEPLCQLTDTHSPYSEIGVSAPPLKMTSPARLRSPESTFGNPSSCAGRVFKSFGATT